MKKIKTLSILGACLVPIASTLLTVSCSKIKDKPKQPNLDDIFESEDLKWSISGSGILSFSHPRNAPLKETWEFPKKIKTFKTGYEIEVKGLNLQIESKDYDKYKNVVKKIVIHEGIEIIKHIPSLFKTIELPSSVKEIRTRAFYDDRTNYILERLDMSKCTNLTIIGQEAFKQSTLLNSISWPPNLKEIHYGAFWGCEKLNIHVYNLPDSVEFNSTHAFMGNDIKHKLGPIILPKNLKKLGTDSFSFKNVQPNKEIFRQNENYDPNWWRNIQLVDDNRWQNESPIPPVDTYEEWIKKVIYFY